MKKPEPLNLLELKPVRRVEWEAGENGWAVLLVPKFRNAILARWIAPFLASPVFRVKLDDFGTFVWSRCDGATPVLQIADGLRVAFGESAEPLYERLGRFIARLERDDLIEVVGKSSQ